LEENAYLFGGEYHNYLFYVTISVILIEFSFRYNSFRYDRADELVWIKTNQLQRLIRTGRTGHWLNHSKEHCLVGIKGNPEGLNWGLDCDVLVGEVRFVYYQSSFNMLSVKKKHIY
jgi:N6-adenosine-specific RNA methylase IME4